MRPLTSLTLHSALLLIAWCALSSSEQAKAQSAASLVADGRYAEVNFSAEIQPWDGFGVNYVETAQTTDYDEWPQEYGGFSTLSEEQRQEILQLIFGPDGLKPGIVKMFLDPFHEPENDNDNPFEIDWSGFDHERTTEWMRYFVRNGLDITRRDGRDLQIITTLYGPPAWTTEQEVIHGRDIDPQMKFEIGEYMLSWVKYLQEEEGFPVKYLSFHNEGDRPGRWNPEGDEFVGGPLDYNMHWPPEQVVDFLQFMPEMVDHFGLDDLGLANGETVNWKFFAVQNYAGAIAENRQAFDNLDLITSHSFWNPSPAGVSLLRWVDLDLERGRYLHAWTTSRSWRDMTVSFIHDIYRDIYEVGVNGITQWAVIQTGDWLGGDPNPGTAFRVDGEGGYSVEPGYHFYKQVSRAGQPGMQVVETISNQHDVNLIGFGANGTDNQNAFVVINRSEDTVSLPIKLRGTGSTAFSAFRSSPTEHYEPIGDYARGSDGFIVYEAPAGSVTTFFAE